MQLVFLKYFESKYLMNFLVALLPLSFIAGNLVINLNVVLIITFAIFFFSKSFFSLKLKLVDKLFLLLFSFSILTGFFNNIIFSEFSDSVRQDNFIKSIVFLRYLLFYFSIKILVEKKILNFKIFFISASLSALFVSLDIMLQLATGKDIFGYPGTESKMSGPFGDEFIAGSYLQRFSIFIFFLFPSITKIKSKLMLSLILSAFFIFVFLSMLAAGNRMPIILFLLMFTFLFLIEKKLRKYSLVFILSFSILFLIIINFSIQVQDYTQYFLRMISEILFFLFQIYQGNENPIITNTYLNEFYSGYETLKQNILIGGGINSFYINCVEVFNFCSSHPHNYYLEIISEIGLLGFAIVLAIFTIILYSAIDKRNELTLNFNNNLIFPFFLLFLIEIFPIKSSGSFFTTGNSTFIFFLLAIIAGLSKKN